jgi:hypothetical protein
VNDIGKPEGEARRPALATRTGKVREGTHGDWAVTIWLPTQAEAQDFARMANDRFRKPKAEVAAS